MAELQTVETIAPIHQAQLLSSPKAMSLRLGPIIKLKV
jgi:hypothetical protein